MKIKNISQKVVCFASKTILPDGTAEITKAQAKLSSRKALIKNGIIEICAEKPDKTDTAENKPAEDSGKTEDREA